MTPKPKTSFRSQEEDDLSELSDSLSDADDEAPSPEGGLSTRIARRSRSPLNRPLSIWDKGWGALLPQKSNTGAASEVTILLLLC